MGSYLLDMRWKCVAFGLVDMLFSVVGQNDCDVILGEEAD